KQYRTALLGQLLGGHGSRDLERHLVGVDVVVRTIEHSGFQAEQRIAGENTVLHLLFDALLDSRNVFLRNHTTDNLVLELQTFRTFVGRLEADPAMTKLATTTGLTNKLAFDLALVANHLAIGNLRLTDVCLDTELATHTVYDDVQVQLTHTTDDGLAGFLVGAHAERGVFLSQTTQRDTHLLLVSLGFRLDGYVNNRLREVHTLKDDRIGDVAQGVTGGDVLHADQGSDVACTHFLDFLTIVGMHLHHTTNALLLALDRVDDGVTRGQNTGVDANEGQSTNEGVSCDLERQRRERRFVGRFALVDFLFIIRVNTLDRRHFVRSRQEF